MSEGKEDLPNYLQAEYLAKEIANGSPIRELLRKIQTELCSARQKFPAPNLCMTALTEEVGELAEALLDKPRSEVEKEAIQVAVMAMRVILDGDPTLDSHRENKGLDSIIE